MTTGNGAIVAEKGPTTLNPLHSTSLNGAYKGNQYISDFELAAAISRRILPPDYYEEIGQKTAANLLEVLNSLERNYPLALKETSSEWKYDSNLTREQNIENQLIEHESGIPLVKKNVPIDIIVLQDCGGAETILRSDVNFKNVGPLGPLGIKFLQVPSLSPESIGACLQSLLAAEVEYSRLEEHKPFVLDNGIVSVKRDIPLVVIFNAAKRTNDNEGRIESQSNGRPAAPFKIARCGYNVILCGTDSGEFGCIQEHLNGPVRQLPITEVDIYRSRRLPNRISRWRQHDLSQIGDIVEPVKPTVNTNNVLIADSFGNIKTSLRPNDDLIKSLKFGDKVLVKINGRVGVALYEKSLEKGQDGELVFAQGTTVHDNKDYRNSQVDLYVKNRTSYDATSQFFPEHNKKAPDLAPVAGAEIKIARINTLGTKILAKLLGTKGIAREIIANRFVNEWL